MKNRDISTAIVARKPLAKQFDRRSPQKSPHRQLPLFDSPQPTQNYPLTIERLPDALQWWDEERFWLIHEASKLRVPGGFTLAEAQKIQKITEHWDWTFDSRDRKVRCGLNLLALAEGICQESHQSRQSQKNAASGFLVRGGEV